MKKIICLFVIALFLPFIHAEAPKDNFVVFEDHGEYCQIKLRDAECLYLYDKGFPILPYYTKTYYFPPGTKINEIQVTPKGCTLIDLSKKVMPSPSPLPTDTYRATDEREEGSIYNEDIFYPTMWSTYNLGMGIVGGHRQLLLTVHLFPARYNPVKNQLHYATNFDITMDYEPPQAILSPNSTYALLIIAPQKWVGMLEDLKTEKERIGIATKIVGLNDIRTGKYFPISKKDDAEQIKYFIKDAIEEWGILSVLLVGDADVLPVRYANTSIGDVPCDLYFADIFHANGTFSSWDNDGDGIYGERVSDKIDKYPDVHIGRLPASNEQELDILIQKIRGYDQPPMKAIMVGTELFWDTEEREGEYLKEETSKELNMEIIKLYETDDYPHNGTANAETIIDTINGGAFLVNFAAHGNPYGMGWEAGSFGINEANSLSNTYLPIVFAMSCSTNQFDDTDCLGETFLLSPNGGAIAYAGSSRVAYVYTGEGITHALSGYLDKAFFKAYYDGGATVGELFTNAKVDYLANHPFYNDIDWVTLIEHNLLGDPTIPLPPMPLTSKASTSKTHSNEKITISSNSTETATVDLYYREKVGRGGTWKFYGSLDTIPYEWEFLPEDDGNYEFYTVLRKDNYTENPPGIPDASCLFDFTPPLLEIQKPEPGGLYVFNRKLAVTNLVEYAIVLGKIEVEVEGDLHRADFYCDNDLMFSDETAPFTWVENRLPRGMHTLKIVGYDIAGNNAYGEIEILTLNIFP